jgi:hypothetical protein
VASKSDEDLCDEMALIYRHLKITLKQCREQLDRIEEMLRKSNQDNNPVK